jgi:hypothetical protein
MTELVALPGEGEADHCHTCGCTEGDSAVILYNVISLIPLPKVFLLLEDRHEDDAGYDGEKSAPTRRGKGEENHCHTCTCAEIDSAVPLRNVIILRLIVKVTHAVEDRHEDDAGYGGEKG